MTHLVASSDKNQSLRSNIDISITKHIFTFNTRQFTRHHQHFNDQILTQNSKIFNNSPITLISRNPKPYPCLKFNFKHSTYLQYNKTIIITLFSIWIKSNHLLIRPKNVQLRLKSRVLLLKPRYVLFLSLFVCNYDGFWVTRIDIMRYEAVVLLYCFVVLFCFVLCLVLFLLIFVHFTHSTSPPSFFPPPLPYHNV